MKLIFAIVSNDDANSVQNGLVGSGFKVTRLNTAGGFLMHNNTTFLCGVEDEKVDAAIDIIEKHTRSRVRKPPEGTSGMGIYAAFPLEVEVGGATIFVTDVERYEKV